MGTSHLFHRAARIASLFLLSWLSLHLAGQAAPRPRFHIESLGTLPGGDAVMPFALNNPGQVVGWASDSNGVRRAFLFRDGAMTELPLFADPGYAFYDINDVGQIVAIGTVSNCCFRAYFITPDGIIDLHAQTGLDLQPVGINNSGVIAANSWRQDFTADAVTWSNGVVRYLDPAHRTYARHINNRGQVVGTFYQETSPGPGSFTTIIQDGTVSVLGSFFEGQAINDHGHVAGLAWSAGRHAFLYRPGGSLDLGTLRGDYFSWAWKLNNADQVIGESEDGDDHKRPFLYTDGRMYSLRDLIPSNSGWTIFSVNDINDHGQIVGTGIHRDVPPGEYRGFLLTPAKNLR